MRYIDNIFFSNNEQNGMDNIVLFVFQGKKGRWRQKEAQDGDKQKLMFVSTI